MLDTDIRECAELIQELRRKGFLDQAVQIILHLAPDDRRVKKIAVKGPEIHFPVEKVPSSC